MVDAVTLITELEKKGGLLGLLKDIHKAPEKYAEEATKIWRAAFKSTATITAEDIGRFHAIFRAIYARARPERKRQLLPYLERYEKLWEEFRRFRENIDLKRLDSLIHRGERIYTSPKMAYLRFLQRLHTWIADIYVYVRDVISKVLPNHDILKYYNIMVHAYLDLTTEYVGSKGPHRNLEFVFSSFIHIENFIHLSNIEVEGGRLPVALARAYEEIIPALAEDFGYEDLLPGQHPVGNWDDVIYLGPFTESDYREVTNTVKPIIHEMATQIGLDIKDDYAILESLDQAFPAYFIIFDHDYGTDRGSRKGYLLWDYPARPLSYILENLKVEKLPPRLKK